MKKTCLNLATIGHLDFESQLEISAKSGFKAVGLRLNSIEDYLSRGNTLEMVKEKLNYYGLVPVEMNYFSNWIYAKGEEYEIMIKRFKKSSSISRKLKCPILILTTHFDGEPDHSLAIKNFKEICNIASEDGNLAALEFLPWSEINNIKKAWDIVKEVDHPNAGIVLDTFHYFEGGSSIKDLQEVPIEKIFLFHICDIKEVDTDVVTLCRNYRVLPGEGVYNFDELLEYLFKSGYDGYYSLEILNKDYSQRDPLELTKKAKKSLDLLCKKY